MNLLYWILLQSACHMRHSHTAGSCNMHRQQTDTGKVQGFFSWKLLTLIPSTTITRSLDFEIYFRSFQWNWNKSSLGRKNWNELPGFGMIFRMRNGKQWRLFPERSITWKPSTRTRSLLKMLYEWELPISADIVCAANTRVEARPTWDKSFGAEHKGFGDEGKIVPVSCCIWRNPCPGQSRTETGFLKWGSKPFQKRKLGYCRGETLHIPPVQNAAISYEPSMGTSLSTSQSQRVPRIPRRPCKMFGLSTNDLGGWLTKPSITLYGKVLPESFEEIRKSMIQANEQKLFAMFETQGLMPSI